ncbi:variable surface lipoprotein [Mycoplasma sp. Mirounga ES2805-ORL]|uniref:variable surface lipoprotein n=1 Tax=Mycoplasma sp. Mirounga ES2805-ORL TaxID=754514 RepID=UPI00197B8102|nr:variable surface lipoprotein [Mycoplasma sp. Mirounga ES2805-ORL]QSF13561.1 hypothetical protein JXZ90_02725 [Mycoplasma sp. Mirounga ES2805-ORL]
MKKIKLLNSLAVISAATFSLPLVASSCGNKKEDPKPNKPETPVVDKDTEIKNVISNVDNVISIQYKTVADSITDESKKTKVNAEVQKLSDNAVKTIKENKIALINLIKDDLSVETIKKVGQSFDTLSSQLNSVLVGIVEKAIKNKPTVNGTEFIKSFLSDEKMNQIKDQLADTLASQKTTLIESANELFDLLKTKESTKSITVIDSFATQMSEFFKNKIDEVVAEIKKVQINTSEGLIQSVKPLLDVFKNVKTSAAAKAHEILTEASDYNAVQNVLKPIYESLEAVLDNNFQALVNGAIQTAKTIDDIAKLL